MKKNPNRAPRRARSLVPVSALAGLALAWSAPAAAQQYIAGINGAPCSYTTIQAAIDALGAGGGTVFVQPGSYVENLLITKDLVLAPGATGQDCTVDDLNNRVAISPADVSGAVPLVDIGGGVHIVKLYSLDLSGGRHDYNGGNIRLTRYLDTDPVIELSIYDSTITDGSALHGGGIGTYYRGGGTIYLSNTHLDGNDADADGGAIYNWGYTLLLDNGTTLGSSTGNDAGDDGGAIYHQHQIWQPNIFLPAETYPAELYALGASRISQGTANSRGGCIGGGDSRVFIEDDAVVDRCSAGGDGGAIDAEYVYVRDNAIILNTSASGHGGAIDADYVEMSESAKIRLADAGGDGGAIRTTDLVMLNDAAIEDSNALLGRGGCAQADTVTMHDSSLMTRCDATTGGAAYVETQFTMDANAQLVDGTAATDGGLLYLEGSTGIGDPAATAQVNDNARFSLGTATANGGLVYVGPGASASFGDSVDFGKIVLTNGSADLGGAIYAEGDGGLSAAVVVLDEATEVQASTATYGGGIYLDGADLELYDLATIGGAASFGNSATVDGGGIYATGSDITVWGDKLSFNTDPLFNWDIPGDGVRIEGNTAVGQGGGAWLGSASTLIGANDTNLVVASNEATGTSGTGGGLAATNGSIVDLERAVFQANIARRGGGAYLAGSTFTLDPGLTYAEDCPAPAFNRYCAEFSKNKATTAGAVDNNGGAIHAVASDVILRQAGVQHNLADFKATAVYLGDSAYANLQNVLVATEEATTKSMVLVTSTAEMDAEFSTFADHGTTVVYQAGATGYLYGNVIWSEGGPGTGLGSGGPPGPTGSCNLGQVGPLGTFDDPDFIPTLDGDYRLGPNSPALDHCSAGPDRDIVGRPRPVPQGTVHDAGAFEML